MVTGVNPEGVWLIGRCKINVNRPVVNTNLVNSYGLAVTEDERGELGDAVTHVTFKNGYLFRVVTESEIFHCVKTGFGIPPVIFKGMGQIRRCGYRCTE